MSIFRGDIHEIKPQDQPTDHATKTKYNCDSCSLELLATCLSHDGDVDISIVCARACSSNMHGRGAPSVLVLSPGMPFGEQKGVLQRWGASPTARRLCTYYPFSFASSPPRAMALGNIRCVAHLAFLTVVR